MPIGTFEYRDEAEKAAIEQHIAFVQQMRDLAVTAPHGQVLDRLEGHAVDAGRELLRTALERAAQANIEQGGGKKGRIAPARTAAGGTTRGGANGRRWRPWARSVWTAGIAAARIAAESGSPPIRGWGWTGT